MTSTDYECARCLGKGRILIYQHIIGGVCFKCRGTGRVKTKPSKASALYYVFGVEQATGRHVHLYNVRGQSLDVAVRKARDTFSRASCAFRNEYTLAEAVAVAKEDLTGLRGWTCECGIPNYLTTAESECTSCGSAISPETWNQALITNYHEESMSRGRPQ